MANPYTNSPSIKDGSYEAQVNLAEMGPNASYAALPDDVNGPYDDGLGYADPVVPGTLTGTPDAQRLGQFPIYSVHPVDQATYYQRLDADRRERYSVEIVDADGWNELPGWAKTAAPNPRSVPTEPERPMTRDRSGNTYSYQRPFGAGLGEERFNGMHFSMADNIREWDIYGMKPVQQFRNTYRLDPAPWDTYVVDTVPQYQPPQATYESDDSPSYTAGGSYRL